MRLIDEQYTRAPFYGVPRMTALLRGRDYPVISPLNASDGIGSRLSQTLTQPTVEGAQEISLSYNRFGHRPARPSLGDGSDVHPS